MSVRTMAKVWADSQHNGSPLLMLLAIADFADDDGNAYPSVTTLATKCRMQVRNAQTILARLRRSGELEVRENEGPRGTNLYRITLVHGALGVQSLAGVRSYAGVQRLARRGAKACAEGVQRTAPEPSMSHQEPSAQVAAQPRGQIRVGRPLPGIGNARKPKAAKVTFAQFLQSLDGGAQAIPPGDPIFSFAEQIGLQIEFLALAWRAFKRRYTVDQPDKEYADWRAVFRRAVRDDWLKLWRASPEGGYTLTTAGVQQQRAAEQEMLHEHA